MEKESFDYSKVPHNFGLCAAADCPHADTCLRRIAYTHTPASVTFPPTLNPKTIEAMAGKCEYYRSNQKVRYAKGFVRTTEALAVSASVHSFPTRRSSDSEERRVGKECT